MVIGNPTILLIEELNDIITFLELGLKGWVTRFMVELHQVATSGNYRS
jgi:hypothetical protein